MTELEAKFSLSSQQYAEIKNYFTGKKKYHSFAITELREELLENSYFDTIDQHLVKADAALRIRKSGAHFYLTFKQKEGNDKKIQSRKEQELLLFEEPKLTDKKLEPCASARAIVGDLPLQAIARLKTKRTIFYFRQNAIVIEMALDAAQITHPREESFFELELELKKGSRDDLHSFAEQMKLDFTLDYSLTTKLNRALDRAEKVQ